MTSTRVEALGGRRDSSADLPDTLTVERHRNVDRGDGGVWFRRGVVALLAAIAVLGLGNVFGQRPRTVHADAAAVRLTLYAPTAIRGGDFMEARFHIRAKQDIKKAVLRLDPGWAEGMSINEIEPSPLNEASDDGRLSFELGHIPAGKSFLLFMQFQVNPTNVAWHRPQNVEFLDGNRVLTRLHRTITVFP